MLKEAGRVISEVTLDHVWEHFSSFSPSNPIFIAIIIICIAKIVSSPTRQAITEDETVGNKKEKVKEYRLPLKQLISRSYLLKQFKNIFRHPKEKFLSNFVGALYIISYRHEWGRYCKYDPSKYKLRRRKKEPRCRQSPKSCWTLLLESLGLRKSSPLPSDKRTYQPNSHRKTKKLEDDLLLDHNHNDCQLITINVSGIKFITQLRCLNHFPDTLLGNEALREPFYDPETREYFFDRHRRSFEGVMYYYQSGGILKRPNGVPIEIFTAELTYFQMKEALQKSKKPDTEMQLQLPKNLLTKKIWLLFEYPESSPQAYVIGVLSILVVAVSIFTFCAITLPLMAFTPTDEIDAIKTTENDNIYAHRIAPFFLLDTVCICWFIFEVMMRGLSCPNAKDFFKDFMNIVDIIAIMPYVVDIIFNDDAGKNSVIQTPGEPQNNVNDTSSGNITTVFKVARLVRVFKLSRHSAGLKVLGNTLKASMKELSLLILFLLIGVVFFSSIIFFAEESEVNTPFQSIPGGFWWSIVTMTTVGYGDIVPVGIFGKLIGSACSLVGVLTLALPVPIVGSNFEYFYHARSSTKKKVSYVHVENCPNRNRDYNEKTRKSEESDSDFEPLKYAKGDCKKVK